MPYARLSRIAAAALLFALPLEAARAPQPPAAQDSEDWTYHSHVPLGSAPLSLKPSGAALTLMATAESPMFEGWHRVTRKDRRILLDASGTPVRAYPQHLRFRVTASARGDRVMPLDRPDPISGDDANAWLKGLSFRLKIFTGLHSREVEPASIQHLGMPIDVPYDERIYQISFDLDDVPATDRLVLEIFSPDGTRVGRFHLELL